MRVVDLDIYDAGEPKTYVIESRGIILGNYKTQERALEVLDEIFEQLKGTNILKYLNKNNGNMNNVFPILTYQMPKE